VSLVVGMLLLGSGALHIVGLLPAQGTHYPAADTQGTAVVQQAILAAGWLVAALGVMSRRPFSVAACLGAVGIGLAELGLAVANFAQVAAATTAGVGAWLALLAWIPGLAGAVIGLGAAWRTTSLAERPGGPHRTLGVRGLTLALATLIVAIPLGVALLPGWDHYVLTSSTLGRTVGTKTLGSAFAPGAPGGVRAGDLLSAVAFALLPLVAVIWRPARAGLLLSGGVLVVVASQVVAAIVGFREPASFFGLSGAVVSQYGLVLHSSLTGWFGLELIASSLLLGLVIVQALAIVQSRQLPGDWLPSGPSVSTAQVGSGGAIPHEGGGRSDPAIYPWSGSYPPHGTPTPQASPRPYQ
jgi:hypothetical protein